MKKSSLLFAAVSLAALLLVYRGVQPAPPGYEGMGMTVNCGGKSALVGCWSASWDGGPEGTSFVACGDSPTSSYARERLEVFSGQPGEVLTLNYGEKPTQLKVSFTPDDPEAEVQTLFEGAPESIVVNITLPENCGGIWETHASWDLGSRGRGSGSAGFVVEELLVEPEGENTTDLFQLSSGDRARKSPPDLTLILGEVATKAWPGSYEWTWPENELSMGGIIACGASPLDAVDMLPSLRTVAWDTVELKFEGRAPSQITVTAYDVTDTAMEAGERVDLTDGRFLELGADGGRGKVYHIQAKWTQVEGRGGSGEYAFAIPEPERGGLPCGGGIEAPEGATADCGMPG